MFKSLLYPAIGLTYISQGAHWVVVTWLAASVLAFSPFMVGALMAAMFAVQIVLLPQAGRLADTTKPTLIAHWAAVALCVCHILLMALVSSGFSLTGGVLVLYALVTSATTAVFLPAKEKACITLMPNRMQKALALGNAYQFLGVAIGAALAGFVESIRLAVLFGVQGGLMALAAGCWAAVQKQPIPNAKLIAYTPNSVPNRTDPKRAEPKKTDSKSTELKGPIALIKSSPVLQHLLLLCAFNGFMHMGFAMALFPVLGVQHWRFDSFDYALMQGVFSLGAVLVYVINAYRKPQQYPGQGMLFCLLYTAVIAYAITREPTFWGSYALIFLWGITAGYSASMSRLVLHTVVADNQRGMAAALYQMVLLGAAPLGALACGAIIYYAGLWQALSLLSQASVALFVMFLFSRKLWAVEQPLVTDVEQLPVTDIEQVHMTEAEQVHTTEAEQTLEAKSACEPKKDPHK